MRANLSAMRRVLQRHGVGLSELALRVNVVVGAGHNGRVCAATSALENGLAPPGHHTVYLACPAAPFAVDGGWAKAGEQLVEDLLGQVEQRAPGFRDSIQALVVRTPEHMARELRWPGAYPMHLDVTPDQLGPLRPIAALGGNRTPIEGHYVSGAGSAPVGGIAEIPGRATARAVLRDVR